MGDAPKPESEPSFSELTAQLVEQTAALAGERLSAPIKAAGIRAARVVAIAALGGAAFALGIVFLGVGIGYCLQMAPEAWRWWICFAVAAAFLAVGAGLTALAVRRPGPEREPRDPNEPGP